MEKKENSKEAIFIKNEKIDYLFGFYGGGPAITKQDKFKPIDVVEIDKDGNQTILNNMYLKKPGKASLIEFEKSVKKIASECFTEENRIRMPFHVEVDLSFSITEKRFMEVDIDNLSKSVLDALSGVAFDDDVQVTQLFASKHIHPMKLNGLLISITKLTESRTGLHGNIQNSTLKF